MKEGHNATGTQDTRTCPGKEKERSCLMKFGMPAAGLTITNVSGPPTPDSRSPPLNQYIPPYTLTPFLQSHSSGPRVGGLVPTAAPAPVQRTPNARPHSLAASTGLLTKEGLCRQRIVTD
mmetsp:Transcript_94374/g.158419  ORF Transcript_94374/g.158419 Transcript_94374/m.158419 type:complete len:120 (-) Transcript_94374:2305-2664(-)